MLPVFFSLAQHISCPAIVCQNYLNSDAMVVAQAPSITYQSPITITKGGTYSGNWQSLDANVPAVTIKTSEPVTIENSRLRGQGDLILAHDGNVELTVRNTYGYGLNPNVYGQIPGRFITVYQPTNIVVENCYMDGTSGIRFNGDGWATQRLQIRYNSARNIDGRKSDGNGGFIADSYDWAQFVQLDKVRQGLGIDISWNEVINEPHKSRVEDNISMYLSSGTSSNPIRIYDNYIQGGYPANPDKDPYSGGGIMIGDGSSTTVSGSTAFVRAYNNQVISTTNHGISIAAGHDNEFYNNRIISSGLLPDGTRPVAQNIGALIWDLYGDSSKGTFYNNFAYDNTIGWVRADGARNDTWFPNCESGKCTNNTSVSNPISLDTEKTEFQTWQNKVASEGVKIGPNF